ncbi:MAG: hypothetical protein REI11_02860 [Patulibacter sp.]|nr:hypothetical protein [Patulibacter sp.]
MEGSSIKLSMTGKVSYLDEISIAQAARIIGFLNADEDEAAELGSPAGQASAGSLGETPKVDLARPRPVQSPRDAIEVSGAKKNPEKIVALGAYVLLDGGETFKAEDVKGQFRRARETAPGNFSRDLSAAVTAGWIAEDSPGEYYLTNKVGGILEGEFSFASTAGRPKAPRKTSKATKKKEKPAVFADIDEFASTMDGFPAYSKAKTAKDKLLWVLALAKSYGIKGLANKDIEWLTDHIGDGIPNGQITGAFNSAKSAGLANRSTQDRTLRINEPGLAYLAKLGSHAES